MRLRILLWAAWVLERMLFKIDMWIFKLRHKGLSPGNPGNGIQSFEQINMEEFLEKMNEMADSPWYFSMKTPEKKKTNGAGNGASG